MYDVVYEANLVCFNTFAKEESTNNMSLMSIWFMRNREFCIKLTGWVLKLKQVSQWWQTRQSLTRMSLFAVNQGLSQVSIWATWYTQVSSRASVYMDFFPRRRKIRLNNQPRREHRRRRRGSRSTSSASMDIWLKFIYRLNLYPLIQMVVYNLW